MSTITRFLTSTIGRKVLMSATGLALVAFLIVHLLGNLLIVFGGRESFNAYSQALLDMKPWIWLAEIGLAVLFVAHAVTAIQLSRLGKAARPQGYYGFGLAGHTSRKTPMSSNMIRTGILVALFVVLHLMHFKFGTSYDDPLSPGRRDLFRLVVERCNDVLFVITYLFFMLVLGMHLVHGIHSAFQTFGVPHRKGIMRATQGLAIVLAVGFGIIPVIVHFMGEKLAS